MPSIQGRRPQVQKRSRAKRSTGGGGVAEGHRLSSRGRPTRAAAAEKAQKATALAAAKELKAAAKAVKAKAKADKAAAAAAAAAKATVAALKANAKIYRAQEKAFAAAAARCRADGAAAVVLTGNHRFCTWIDFIII